MKPYMLVALLGFVPTLSSADPANASYVIATPPAADDLKAPEGEVVVLVAKAKGFQTYECRPKKDHPDQYEWAFTGPEADLFDPAGNKIGRHFAGPTWELTDGSSVVGTVLATVPSTAAGAVPWLLLAAKGHHGEGRLSKVADIQRLETSGGKAPADGASQATAGQKLRVPYTATYYFYAPKP